jgi:hypothetical protein
MVSPKEVQLMKSKWQSAQDRLARFKEEHAEKIEPFKRSAVGGATAFAVGVAEGKLGEEKSQVFGIPLSLGSAMIGHSLAYFGVGGDYVQEVHDAADGPLFLYLGTKGRQVGMKWRVKAAASPSAKTAGESDLTDEERERIARNAR